MKPKSLNVVLAAAWLLSLVLAAACVDPPQIVSGTKVNDLRVGVLPLVSALPVFVADGEGFFEEEGLNVTLVPFNSALEEDAALQAGEIDGYFSDPVNTIVMIKGGVGISMVNAPYKANPKSRMFAIVASAKSGIDSVAKLKGVEVGISKATIIEYLQDGMLEKNGFTAKEIAGQEIKQIPIRLQLLLSGVIPAAILPEPLVSLAEYNKAKVIVDDRILDSAETVVALKNSLMSQDPSLKGRFLNGLKKAANRINSDSGSYSAVLLANVSIPKEIQSSYVIPEFPVNALPSEKEINEIQDWMVGKGIMDRKIEYEKLVK